MSSCSVKGYDMSKQSDEQEFWHMVITSQRASGLTVQAFCDQEGISPSSFYRWRKILGSPPASADLSDTPFSCDGVSPEPTFIPVGQITSVGQALRITFPAGIEVHVSNGCHTALLGETVRLLCERQC